VTEKTKIFEIEIVLEDVRPSVRRLVPGDASLSVLHEVVQSAMGWTNSHLHEFEIGGERYGMSAPTGTTALLPTRRSSSCSAWSGRVSGWAMCTTSATKVCR
jgi:hypothetical protein